MTGVFAEWRAWILFFGAIVINFVFLSYYHHANNMLGLVICHGGVAHSVYKYNSVKVNPTLTKAVHKVQIREERLVDFAEFADQDFGPPTKYHSVNDTIGYGVILGLLWKITGSLRYLDIQLLQIFLFSLLTFLLYSLCLLWFESKALAFIVGCAHLYFLPLYRQNVFALRDIFAYYGLLLLLYGVSAFLLRKTQHWHLSLCVAAASLCQWVRPTLFFNIVACSVIIGLYALINYSQFFRLLKGVVLIGVTNLLVFWVPFMAYNKMAHNRYFATPRGQMLLEGLGEFPNKWGFKISDAWVGAYLYDKYGVVYGTPEFNDRAHEEFVRAVNDDPSYYLKTIMSRLPKFFYPEFVWFHTDFEIDFSGCSTAFDRLKARMQRAFSSFSEFGYFLLRLSGRIYFLLGYLGLLLALIHRRWMFIFVLYFGGLLPAIGIVTSHLEPRYLIPFYGVFPIFVGYALWCFLYRLKSSKPA